jgi:arabinose-5-phosphate isomerase
VHPGEAYHGDLGMIQSVDVALLISHSGETEEILRFLPFLKYQNNKINSLVVIENDELKEILQIYD